jgi:uncharacterized protein (TIGR02996 family)
MSPEEAFLADIIAHPDDDTPRLVYADWLDEHDQPDRAEFIRVQIQHFHESGDCGLEWWWPRERELYRAHGRAWQEGLPEWVKRRCGFRRGFVEVVGGTARQFLKDGPRIRARVPLRGVSLERTRGVLDQVLDSPLLAVLQELSLRVCDLGPAEVRAVVSCPRLAGLRKLDLFANPLGDEGLRVIAEAPALAGLRSLELENCRVGSAGVRALAASRYLTRLARLDLSRNEHVADIGAEALAGSANMRGLVDLSLLMTGLGPAGARLLFASPHLAGLRKLNLAFNAVGDPGAVALAEASPLASLEVLNLGGNGIGDAGAEALAACPRLGRLRLLILHNSAIGDAGALALARSPHLEGLNLLDLQLNRPPISAALRQALLERFGRRVRLTLGA